MTREETLKIWPDARWFQGDPPPVGTRVSDGDDMVGIVTGMDEAKTKDCNHCPTCTCQHENYLWGWWFVTIDGWFQDKDGSYVKAETGGKPMVSYKFPPCLKEVAS